jgi:hypothetical protein
MIVLTLNAARRFLFGYCLRGKSTPVETHPMFRTPLIAALTVALLGGTALAQPASAPPTNLNDYGDRSNSARNAPDYDEDDRGPGPNDRQAPVDARQANPNAQATADEQRDRDIFCRRDAAARTGYTTPREAARDEQTRGTVGGVVGGAVLGTVLGAAAGNAGLGAAAGAGAGLIAGTAIGSDNARRAARDVEADYSAAYYACMHQADTGPRSAYYDDRYGDYGPPPAPVYYGRPYYPYYYGPAYGPSLSFGFGFGGGGWGHRGWGGGGWGGGHRGFHGGGGRHR